MNPWDSWINKSTIQFGKSERTIEEENKAIQKAIEKEREMERRLGSEGVLRIKREKNSARRKNLEGGALSQREAFLLQNA